MTAPPFDAIVSWLGGRLLVGSGEAVILVSLVWFACRRGNLSAAMQATLWWLTALKIVIVLLPLPAVTLPLLPAPATVPITVVDVGAIRTTAEATLPAALPGGRNTNAVSWNSIAIAVWLFVVVAHALRLFGQHLYARRMVRRSVPSSDEIGPLASAIGLRRIPAVHSSSDIDAPQIVGVVRPVILMPSAPMAEADRIMALSHELMHVRRRDLALGWIPAISERLFFFHPLVRLAGREYRTAREAACDAAVVQVLGVPAGDYGRLLVRFGVASDQPAFVAGGASRSMSSLRRRLAMLQQSSSNGSQRIGWALSTVMLLAMIPIQLVAQAPSNRGNQLEAVTAGSTVATPREIRPNVRTKVILVPGTTPVLESALEPVGTLVGQEPKELTEEFLQQQLLEVQKALRATQEDAERGEREKLLHAQIAAIMQSIEARWQAEPRLRGEVAREVLEKAVREASERAWEVEYEQALRDADFQVRTHAEYEKALDAARQREGAVSQQEFTEQQLDGLRRTIEQLASQLEEMRKMERQLREQLNRK